MAVRASICMLIPISLRIASVNVTALSTRLHLANRKDDILLCQEAADPLHSISAIAFAARAFDCKARITPADPELIDTTGGMAALCVSQLPVRIHDPQSECIKKFISCGRLQILLLPLPNGFVVTIANVCCWTNNTSSKAMARTNNVLLEVRCISSHAEWT